MDKFPYWPFSIAFAATILDDFGDRTVRSYIFDITVRTQDGDKPYSIQIEADSVEQANKMLTDAMLKSSRVEDLDPEIFKVLP